MPVEVRELVIRAVVGPEPEEERDEGLEPDTGAPRSSGRESAEREAIVEACVRQVLQILRRKKER